MAQDIARSFDLGQPVRLATDPSERCGYVVAIMLVPPYEAQVRWREGSTFEALDNLVEVVPSTPAFTEGMADPLRPCGPNSSTSSSA